MQGNRAIGAAHVSGWTTVAARRGGRAGGRSRPNAAAPAAPAAPEAAQPGAAGAGTGTVCVGLHPKDTKTPAAGAAAGGRPPRACKYWSALEPWYAPCQTLPQAAAAVVSAHSPFPFPHGGVWMAGVRRPCMLHGWAWLYADAFAAELPLSATPLSSTQTQNPVGPPQQTRRSASSSRRWWRGHTRCVQAQPHHNPTPAGRVGLMRASRSNSSRRRRAHAAGELTPQAGSRRRRAHAAGELTPSPPRTPTTRRKTCSSTTLRSH